MGGTRLKIFAVNAIDFASKPAPTLECLLLWERACSRRRQSSQNTIRNTGPRSHPADDQSF
ncbi:hypothetical protein CRX42_23015 [Pseudomonas jessenii]|uniref:Uncharacterized protein n=1 Tax=Pseudomonas jessenii TaxID=77298 RepID=A0A2W0EJH0_PSEJE|nr:hypothetical protein CRX42_23015 [Pseudomonas jessenii]